MQTCTLSPARDSRFGPTRACAETAVVMSDVRPFVRLSVWSLPTLWVASFAKANDVGLGVQLRCFDGKPVCNVVRFADRQHIAALSLYTPALSSVYLR